MIVMRSRLAGYVTFLSASASLASMAHAQSAPPSINAPPVRSPVDDNGVNIATGGLQMSAPQLTIGPQDAGGLSYVRHWMGNGWRHNYFLTITTTSTTAMVSIGGQSTSFTLSGGVYSQDQGNGAKLTATASAFTYTAPDGTIIIFDRSYSGSTYNGYVQGVGTQVNLPSGLKTTLTYTSTEIYLPGDHSINAVTLVSVNTNSGFQLKFIGSSQVQAINNGIDYCNPAAASCTALMQTWPSVAFARSTSGSNTLETLTDALGRVTRYTTNSSGQLIGIKRPSSSSDNITVTYDSNGRVSNLTRDGLVWHYVFSLSGSTMTATVTNPAPSGQTIQETFTADTIKGVILTAKDARNRVTTYTPDASGRITKVVPPEGSASSGYVAYAYDANGNVTTQTNVSKTPGTPATIVTTAGYPSSCTNTCNKPLWTKDALGGETDYTYDSVTGLVTSVTGPAPASGGVRPQVRYNYDRTREAWYKDSSGSIVTSGKPIAVLTDTSTCATQGGTPLTGTPGVGPFALSGTAACSGTADEIQTVVGYEVGTPSVKSNLLPIYFTKRSGTLALTATNALAYDSIGNVTSVDGPLAGTDDTARAYYDLDREVVGAVSPDPDGSGALKPRAARYTYNADGQVIKVERGTVVIPTNDPAGLAVLQTLDTTYDGQARRVRDVLSASGTTYSVSDYSYDAAGRPDCAAQRMNSAAWTTATAACTLQTVGSFGSDRITKTVYDEASEVLKTQAAYGTTLQRDEVTASYNGNGTTASVTDAKGNKTSYAYDGFDRLYRTYYPSPTSAGTSSTTDYEQLGYDAASNVTSRRLRDGTSVAYGYDTLGRRISVTPPGTTWADVGLTYGYDNLGRRTQATDTVYSHSTTFGYDALGRLVTENGPFSLKTMQYDLAGHRTRLDWGDGFFVIYGYDTVGEMTGIAENGTVALEAFVYDDLGRRTVMGAANRTQTSYGYDGASRLTSLTPIFSSSPGSDVAFGFAYNPAGQIVGRTSSNDAYSWSGGYNVSRGYSANGLDQYTALGGVTPAYDARGNLTGAGGVAYTYKSDNKLQLAGGAGNYYYYDAAGRLDVDGAAGQYLDYVGDEVVAERDIGSNAVLRRYVYGPDPDEPLVWYEGSGTGSRRFLHADERGSVIAVTDSSGQPIAYNTYDEYGIPGSANLGRFQYTGQAWIPTLGMYNYKARIYSPTIGRFLQTDPIGYGDGTNWYNYVGGDPVNGTDPLGLGEDCGDASGEICVYGGKPKDPNAGGGYNGGNGDISRPGSVGRGRVGPIKAVAKPQNGDNTPQPGYIVVTASKPTADDGPEIVVNGSLPGFTLIAANKGANDNYPPGANACYAGKKVCVGNVREPNRVQKILQCQSIAARCEGYARDPLGLTIAVFPDGTAVVVVGGVARIVRRGSPF